MIKENILKDVLDNINEIVFLTDRDFNFLLVNFKMEELLELPREYLLRQNLLTYIEKEDLLRETEIGEKFLTFISSTGKRYRYKVNFYTSDRYFEDLKEAILWIGMLEEDVNLSKFQDKLIRLNKMAEIGNLAAGIVHELKNPLAVINQAAGWGRVLVEDHRDDLGSDGDELEKVFEEIENQTQRSKDITDELLSFVRESGSVAESFSPIRLIENSLKLLKSELRYPKIEVEKRYNHTVDRINNDFRLIQQVLINLITNAIYAIREKGIAKGKITISTENEGEFIKISIKDNGIGIPLEKQDKVFEVFYTTKPPGKGTGLGLALCKDIVSRLGGEIGFSSVFKEGSEFYIKIPVGGRL